MTRPLHQPEHGEKTHEELVEELMQLAAEQTNSGMAALFLRAAQDLRNRE